YDIVRVTTIPVVHGPSPPCEETFERMRDEEKKDSSCLLFIPHPSSLIPHPFRQRGIARPWTGLVPDQTHQLHVRTAVGARRAPSGCSCPRRGDGRWCRRRPAPPLAAASTSAGSCRRALRAAGIAREPVLTRSDFLVRATTCLSWEGVPLMRRPRWL